MEVSSIGVGMNFETFLNDVEGHVDMFLLPLFIRFRYSFLSIMRSLRQEECEADVKINAKPITRYCEADVKTRASNLALQQITGVNQICFSR